MELHELCFLAALGLMVPVMLGGLLRPGLVLPKGAATRGNVVRIYGTVFAMLFVLGIVLTPTMATLPEAQKATPSPSPAQPINSPTDDRQLWDFSWNDVKPYSLGYCKSHIDSQSLLELCMQNEEAGFKKMQGDFGFRMEAARAAKRRCAAYVKGFSLMAVCMENEASAARRMEAK